LTLNYIFVKDLVKVYPKDIVALNNVSFSVEGRGIVGLVGPNGAGKTTLIKILATLIKPTGGKAEVLGYDVVREYERIRSRISLVPQDASPELYLTPYEHVYWYLRSRGLSGDDSKRLARDALKKLGLWEYRNRVCARLSGGMRQRVLIASALAVPADIYFLDEPTVGLDPIARREVWEVLKSVSKESLVFLTTHYMEEAELLSDLVIMINRGRIIDMGRPRDLLRNVRHKYKVVVEKTANINGIKAYFVETDSEKIIYVENDRDLLEVIEDLVRMDIGFSLRATSLEDLFIMRMGRHESR